MESSGFKSRHGAIYSFFARPERPHVAHQISSTVGVWTGRNFSSPIPTQRLSEVYLCYPSVPPIWHETGRPLPLPSRIFALSSSSHVRNVHYTFDCCKNNWRKCYCCLVLTKIWIYKQISAKISKYGTWRNSVWWRSACSMHADRRTDEAYLWLYRICLVNERANDKF